MCVSCHVEIERDRREKDGGREADGDGNEHRESNEMKATILRENKGVYLWDPIKRVT